LLMCAPALSLEREDTTKAYFIYDEGVHTEYKKYTEYTQKKKEKENSINQGQNYEKLLRL